MQFRDVKIKLDYYAYNHAITDGKQLVYQENGKCKMIPLREADVIPTDHKMSSKLKEELIYFYYQKMIKPVVEIEMRTYQLEIDYWLASINQYTGIDKEHVLKRIKELSYLIHEG